MGQCMKQFRRTRIGYLTDQTQRLCDRPPRPAMLLRQLKSLVQGGKPPVHNRDSGDGPALLSLRPRHLSPYAYAARSTSSPAHTADSSLPRTSHLHVAARNRPASRPSTPAAPAPSSPLCRQRSPADALPPLPHLLKHLLRPAYKFRLRFFSFHHSTPFLGSLSSSLLSVYPSYTSTRIWDAPFRENGLTSYDSNDTLMDWPKKETGRSLLSAEPAHESWRQPEQ